MSTFANKVDCEDAEEFLEKVSYVEKTIKGLMDGSLVPSDLPAITEYENKVDSSMGDKFMEKSSEAEKLKWWDLARSHKLKSSTIANDQSDNVHGNQSRLGYTNYQVWDKWVNNPDDPVSVLENKRLEDEKLQEFERNNPEFCNQFKLDANRRNEKNEKDIKNGEKRRLAGNQLFKSQKYHEALNEYKSALEITPFDEKILMNIVQSFIKLENFNNALQFCERILYLVPDHVKALSRQGHALCKLGRFKDARESIDQALNLESTNKELLIQKLEIDCSIRRSSLIEAIDREEGVYRLIDEILESFFGASTGAFELYFEENQLKEKLFFTQSSKLLTDYLAFNKESAPSLFGLVVHACHCDPTIEAYAVTKGFGNICQSLIKGDIRLTKLSSFQQMAFDFYLNLCKSDDHVKLSVLNDQILFGLNLAIGVSRDESYNIEIVKVIAKSIRLIEVCLSSNLPVRDDIINRAIDEVCRLVFLLSTIIDHQIVVSLFVDTLIQSIHVFTHNIAQSKRMLRDVEIYSLLYITVIVGTTKMKDLDRFIPFLGALLQSSCSLENHFYFLKPFHEIWQYLNTHFHANCNYSDQWNRIMNYNTIDVLSEFSAKSVSIDCKINVINIFLNLSIESSQETRRYIVINKSQSILNHNDLKKADIVNMNENDIFFFSKVISFASRLISFEEMQSIFRNDSLYPRLWQWLGELGHLNLSFANIDLCANIVKILGACSQSRSVDVLNLSKGLNVIIQLMPLPKSNYKGEITGESIMFRVNEDVFNDIAIGNLCKLMISLWDNHKTIILNCNLFKERLVCCLATCKESRTKKNIAILLAKVCQVDKERIRELRGIEMMLAIQKEL